MTIHYNISEQDCINFNLDHFHSIKALKVLIIILRFIIIPMGILMGILMFHLDGESKSLMLIVVYGILLTITSCLWIIFFPKVHDFLMGKNIKIFIKNGKANDFIGNQTVVLEDDYIVSASAYMVTHLQYSTVERICTGHKLFYIYVGAMKAIVIPFSAFESNESKNSFFEILHQKAGVDISSILYVK